MTERLSLPARYRLHGFTICSDYKLAAVPDTRDRVDFRLLSPPERGLVAPVNPARTLAQFLMSDGSGYSHVRDEHGYLSTFFERVQFRLTADRNSIIPRLAEDADARWIQVLMAASYPAFLVFLSGRVPLHASVVFHPSLDGAVAILGASGGGKTTLGGAICLAGGHLIADDLLSLDEHGRVESGSRELRLRKGASEFAARFGPSRISTSIDGRFVVDANEPLSGGMDLRLLVQPLLDKEATRVQLEELRPTEVFQILVTDPRVKGLADPIWLAAAFQHAARLARTVRVIRVRVPRVTEGFGSIGAALVQALRRAQ